MSSQAILNCSKPRTIKPSKHNPVKKSRVSALLLQWWEIEGEDDRINYYVQIYDNDKVSIVIAEVLASRLHFIKTTPVWLTCSPRVEWSIAIEAALQSERTRLDEAVACCHSEDLQPETDDDWFASEEWLGEREQ